MKITNMTPHAVHIVDASGMILRTIPASGNVVRLSVTTGNLGEWDGVPLTKTIFGEPVGLPDFVDDTLLIVSQLVKNALPSRHDLVVPAEVVRNADGVIVGCQSLGR